LSDSVPCPQSEDLKVKPEADANGRTSESLDNQDIVEVKNSTHQDERRGKWV
jgi:hypothetical protein